MAKTWMEMVVAAKQQVKLVNVNEAKQLIDSGQDPLVVDVREPGEYQQGHIKGAIHIPRGVMEMKVDRTTPAFDPKFADPQKTIIVHCAAGGRSAVAAQTMKAMGYTNVCSMEGGFDGWTKSGYPVER